MKVESATAPSHQKDIDDDRHACLLNVAQTNAGCGLSEESQRYDYVIEGERREGFWQFLTRNWQECSNYHWAIRSFIANNLSRKYRRSVLGFLWGFLAPLMTLAIMSTMFSLIFHMNPERSVKYIFSGLIAWSFISESALQGAGCLISAES